MAVEVNAPTGGTVIVISPRDRVEAKETAYSVDVTTGLIGGTPYSGGYEVIPTTEPQILPTAGKTLGRNVTVGAIPNNYGLITWDGTTITVS